MEELVQESFVDAARRAAANLEGGESLDQGALRDLIKKVLRGEKEKDVPVDTRMAERIAERVTRMIWPEKVVEVMKHQAAQEVARQAEKRYIIEQVKQFLEEEVELNG